ncbi:MAG: hypothetical protein NNA18_02645 [Nitrospira sp.]|nr:hypothetical protein [Nitrospira sp.]
MMRGPWDRLVTDYMSQLVMRESRHAPEFYAKHVVPHPPNLTQLNEA